MKGFCIQVDVSQVSGEPLANGEEPNLTILIPVRYQVTGQVKPSAGRCFSWFMTYKKYAGTRPFCF